MLTEYNIYCDESFHFENHKSKSTVLGAIRCPKDRANDIFNDIRSLKSKHHIPTTYVIRWNHISPEKNDFYCDLVNYFFDNENLHCRILVIPDKSEFIHSHYKHKQEDSYYQMYFALLKNMFEPECSYFLYFNFISNRMLNKSSIIKDILQPHCLNVSENIILEAQHFFSHEAELLQLTNIIIGAFSYLIFNDLQSSPSKQGLTEQIKQQSSNSPKNKLSILIWDPPLKNRRQISLG